VPKTTLLLDDNKVDQTLSFLDDLEEMDDVQHVYSNIDLSDAALDRLRSRT
jgi:transcriptional/translational regulatory protein YebC/TACO1